MTYCSRRFLVAALCAIAFLAACEGSIGSGAQRQERSADALSESAPVEMPRAHEALTLEEKMVEKADPRNDTWNTEVLTADMGGHIERTLPGILRRFSPRRQRKRGRRDFFALVSTTFRDQSSGTLRASSSNQSTTTVTASTPPAS